MRTFLKPFLLAMLALLLATSLTKIDTRSVPGGFDVCAQNAALERPLLAFGYSQTICMCPRAGIAPMAYTFMSGLYARGVVAPPLAAIFGLGLPVLLLVAALLMAVRRLGREMPVVSGAVLTILGGYVFAVASLAQYSQLRLLYGRYDMFQYWLSDPYMPRDALIWLGSGLAVGSGIWLLIMAWGRRALLK